MVDTKTVPKDETEVIFDPATDELFVVHDSYYIDTVDNVKAEDNISTWKRWFNGMKHFFTVKPLPPKR